MYDICPRVYSKDDIKAILIKLEELVAKWREEALNGYAVPEDIADELENFVRIIERTL